MVSHRQAARANLLNSPTRPLRLTSTHLHRNSAPRRLRTRHPRLAWHQGPQPLPSLRILRFHTTLASEPGGPVMFESRHGRIRMSSMCRKLINAHIEDRLSELLAAMKVEGTVRTPTTASSDGTHVEYKSGRCAEPDVPKSATVSETPLLKRAQSFFMPRRKRSDSKESQINQDDKAPPIRSATLQSSRTANTPSNTTTKSDFSPPAPDPLVDLSTDGSRKPRVLRKKSKKEIKPIDTFTVTYKGQPISKPFSHDIELVNGTAEVLDHTVTPPLPILPRSPAPAPSPFTGKQGLCSPTQLQTPRPTAGTPSSRPSINEPTGGDGSPSCDPFDTTIIKVHSGHQAQSDGPQMPTSSANKSQPDGEQRRDSKSALQPLDIQHKPASVETPITMTNAPATQRDRPMHTPKTGDSAREVPRHCTTCGCEKLDRTPGDAQAASPSFTSTVTEASRSEGYVSEPLRAEDLVPADDVVLENDTVPTDVGDLAFTDDLDLTDDLTPVENRVLTGMGLATPAIPAPPGVLYFYPTDILDDEGENILWYFGQDDPYRENVAPVGLPF